MNLKDAEKAKNLRSRMGIVITDAIPVLKHDAYRVFLNKTTHELISMIEEYLKNYHNAADAEHNYALGEEKILNWEKEALERFVTRESLRAYIRDVIIDAIPVLKHDAYRVFLNKTTHELISMIEEYLKKYHNAFEAEQGYAFSEERTLKEIALVLPNASGLSISAREILHSFMRSSFAKAGLRLSHDENERLLEDFDRAFAICAAFIKVGESDKAGKLYEEAASKTLDYLRASFSKTKNIQAENQLKLMISQALDAAGLGLEEYEKKRVQDLMLYIFSDYLEAPETERDEVYSLGEERVLFSLFDPARRSDKKKSVSINA